MNRYHIFVVFENYVVCIIGELFIAYASSMINYFISSLNCKYIS